MSRQQISSAQNNKIKLAVKLLSKRQREKTGLFLIDDARDLGRALDCGYKVDFALFCEELASQQDQEIVARITESAVYDLSADLMKKASYRQNPGGLVAVLYQKTIPGAGDLAKESSSHLLGLVNLSKPGNIGALLRTADASGFDHICLIDSAVDLYNPNIIRASTGAVFLNHIYVMSSSDALAIFQRQNIRILAAHLDGTMDLYDYDFTAQRTAILLGAEDIGLGEFWVRQCNELVKIPMIGQMTDSLNVSVSGAIFMYEALRQTRSIQQASDTPMKLPST